VCTLINSPDIATDPKAASNSQGTKKFNRSKALPIGGNSMDLSTDIAMDRAMKEELSQILL
jgi:hypothetical protein